VNSHGDAATLPLSMTRNLYSARRKHMMTILIVLAVLMLLGAVPAWPHSRNWGYGPSGGLGLIVLILLVLVLSGRL
jgi:hypothetical protein